MYRNSRLQRAIEWRVSNKPRPGFRGRAEINGDCDAHERSTGRPCSKHLYGDSLLGDGFGLRTGSITTSPAPSATNGELRNSNQSLFGILVVRVLALFYDVGHMIRYGIAGFRLHAVKRLMPCFTGSQNSRE
jgi:hypothetical protein